MFGIMGASMGQMRGQLEAYNELTGRKTEGLGFFGTMSLLASPLDGLAYLVNKSRAKTMMGKQLREQQMMRQMPQFNYQQQMSPMGYDPRMMGNYVPSNLRYYQ